MSRHRKSVRRKSDKKVVRLEEPETQAANAVTVAWTVSVTTALMCDLAAVAALFFSNANPGNKAASMLSSLLMLAAALSGLISLLLLPIVYRVRRTPPPAYFAVFAVCVAAAPLLALAIAAAR